MLLVSSLSESIRLDHGGSWVQIPSGARMFSESTCLLEFTLIRKLPSLNVFKTSFHGNDFSNTP